MTDEDTHFKYLIVFAITAIGFFTYLLYSKVKENPIGQPATSSDSLSLPTNDELIYQLLQNQQQQQSQLQSQIQNQQYQLQTYQSNLLMENKLVTEQIEKETQILRQQLELTQKKLEEVTQRQPDIDEHQRQKTLKVPIYKMDNKEVNTKRQLIFGMH